MEQIDKKTQEILDKLTIAQEMFDLASTRVKDDEMKKHLEMISGKKSALLNDLFLKLGMPGARKKQELSEPDTSNNMKGIPPDANEREAIDFCLKNEQELISTYQKFLTVHKIRSENRILMKAQLRESLVLFNQLKMVKESYHYQDRF